MVASVIPWKRCEPVMIRLKNSYGLARNSFLRRVALHEEIEPVDLLPHLAGDLFAGGPRIFARARQTRDESSSDFSFAG